MHVKLENFLSVESELVESALQKNESNSQHENLLIE